MERTWIFPVGAKTSEKTRIFKEQNGFRLGSCHVIGLAGSISHGFLTEYPGGEQGLTPDNVRMIWS